MYTIKEVAGRVGESEHTIRYYCKIGLFPFLTRDKNGVRKFTEEDLEGVRIVLCLRDTNMPLAEIKRYMDLCKQGNETLSERLVIIREQRIRAEEQIKLIKQQIEHLKYKEQCYEQALETQEDYCNPLKR